VSPKKRRVAKPADLSRRIERVVDDVLGRRLAGERVPDDLVIRNHLGLMPELGERLKALKLVERAARLTKSDPPGRKKPNKPDQPDQRYVQGLCPYCKSQYRIRAELAAKKIRCRQCRGVFLSDEFAAAVTPPAWPDENDPPQDAPQG